MKGYFLFTDKHQTLRTFMYLSTPYSS